MNEVERRFKPIDKQLNKYLKDYNKINKKTQDTLQNIFNELDIQYSDLNKKIPDNKKKRLDRRLENLLKDKQDNYMYYILKQALNKRSMTYRELLETYIISAYYEERKSLDEYDNMYFYEALETSYQQGIQDIKKLPRKRRHIDEIFNWSILYTILNIPLLYGTKDAYLYALAMTNADEMYKRAINNTQGNKPLDIDNQDMQDLLQKQRNRLLSINDGKYSGAIENMTESYCNLAYLQSGKDNDVRQCRFIAVIDKRTTEMCESLDNQLFYLDKMNVYQRYSDVDGRMVTYHTKGMVLGENLPPIMNHFHWCRSTITYNIEITSEDALSMVYKKIPVLKTEYGVDYLGGYVDRYGVYHPIKEYEKIAVPNEKDNKEEIELAKWWKREKGGDVQLVPTINAEKGTDKRPNLQTPDILWNGERWDFKKIEGSKESTIKRKFNDYMEQTDNLILYPNTKKTSLTDDEIIKYIEKYFDEYSYHYNSAIYVKHNEKRDTYEIIKEFTK